MQNKAVIGIYDSLAKAEKAELLLEEVNLPVGQMSLFASKSGDGNVAGGITVSEVTDAVASSGIQISEEQAVRYERALEAGKLLLVFRGDADQAAVALRALENTGSDELKVLDE